MNKSQNLLHDRLVYDSVVLHYHLAYSTISTTTFMGKIRSTDQHLKRYFFAHSKLLPCAQVPDGREAIDPLSPDLKIRYCEICEVCMGFLIFFATSGWLAWETISDVSWLRLGNLRERIIVNIVNGKKQEKSGDGKWKRELKVMSLFFNGILCSFVDVFY
jgi:hypothetical protein